MSFKIPSRNLQDAVGGEGYLGSLSNELILFHILDKIRDEESLRTLSMLSKRMASLVFQAETVSVKIPYWGDPYKAKSTSSVKIPSRPGSLRNLLSGHSVRRILIDCLPIRLLKGFVYYYTPGFCIKVLLRYLEFYFRLGFGRLDFLGKFTSMRTLNVEYDFCCSRICRLSNNENPMVKFKFGPNFGTILMAAGVEFLDDYDVDVQGYQNINDDYRTELAALIRHLVVDVLFPVLLAEDSVRRLLIEEVFAKGLLQRLQNVVLGYRKHGKIIIGENELDGMRNTEEVGKWKRPGVMVEKEFHARFARVLKLPSSGCVMTTVVLISYKNLDSDDDADDLLLKEGFGAEEDGGGEEAYVKEAELAMLEKDVIVKRTNLLGCLFRSLSEFF